MIDGKSVLAIITARGGSKGLPRKNVRPVGGRPLVAWSVDAALRSTIVDRVVLSSDDAEIIAAARDAGCEIPFIRPADLATDSATAIDAVHHALRSLPQTYDYVVLLQPTSPLRLAADIDGAVVTCHETDAHSCVSVCAVDKSPYWMYRMDTAGALAPVLDGGPRGRGRRQDQPDVYVINGAVYVAQTAWLMDQDSFVAAGTIGYVMPKERSIDVDDAIDLRLIDLMMSDLI